MKTTIFSFETKIEKLSGKTMNHILGGLISDEEDSGGGGYWPDPPGSPPPTEYKPPFGGVGGSNHGKPILGPL